jgi:hypothetical protein
MADIIVPKGFGTPSKVFDDTEEDKLQGSSGVSFPVLIMKEKNKFIFRYQQKDTIYGETNEDGEITPKPSIEVVIVRARANLSNQYYIPPYSGEKRPPDCFASDGQVPDARVDPKTKQHATCAGCPQKKMGSAFTIKGKPTTACRNQRKVAVIPLEHLENGAYEQYGAALFTITPTSIQNFDRYVNDVLPSIGAERGKYKSFNVVTRIRSDPEVTWQRAKFSAFKALTDAQCEIIKKLREDERIMGVLAQEEYADAQTVSEPTEPTGFEADDDTRQEAAQAQTNKPVTTNKAPATKPQQTAATASSTSTPPPPPPRPGGFAANPQTVAAAINQPATPPKSQRTVQVQQEDVEIGEENLGDEETEVIDDIDAELGGELKRLLSGNT